MMEIKVVKPGKLFIAGEYSIVENGRKALITSVDRFITVTIKKASFSSVESFKDERLSFQRKNGELLFDNENEKWGFIRSSIKVAEEYLSFLVDEFQDYEIRIQSQMDDKSGKKYGLGSSASVTVAVIDAIFKFYNINLEKIKLFKLACLATLENSPNNSCGDIAAISFRDFVYYRNFDHEFIKDKKETLNIYELVNSQWPQLEIKVLEFPETWSFMVGWTQMPASSSDLVKIIRNNSQKDSFYREFQNKSDEYVDRIVRTIEEKDFDSFKLYLEKTRQNLIELSNKYNSEIETKELETLTCIALNLGYASKFSGAGGGDCGIAINDDHKKDNLLIDKWEKNKIKYLDINIFIGEKNV